MINKEYRELLSYNKRRIINDSSGSDDSSDVSDTDEENEEE